MGFEDFMKKRIGRHILWQNEPVVVVNAFSCYDGDFYEYLRISGEIIRINVNTEEGREFEKKLG